MSWAFSMCCSSHLTKVHVICIILKHHHSQFYISTARTVKLNILFFTPLYLISNYKKLWNGEKPDEFDNCLKNLKLKVNFVREVIIHIWHLLLSQSVFQVQWRHICPLSLNSMIEFEFEKLQIWISVGLYGFQLEKCKISFLYLEGILII